MSSRPRLEDYLTTIYRLEEALGVAKITDISRELEVSPASASKVVKRLESKGLVTRKKYHYVTLTDAGRKLAESIIRKHRIAEQFLSQMLGFDDYSSHVYAHYLEHVPEVVIEKLHQVLGFPSMCPHGNPLPGTQVSEDNSTRLSVVKEGSKCVVVRLLGELRELLEFIRRTPVRVGSVLSITARSQNSVVVRVEDRGELIDIPLRIARLIMVRCSEP